VNQDTQKDFFISYNSADRSWAEWLAWQLEEEGYSTVIQAWDFRPGSNFVQEMDTAIQEAERTVAVLSPNYLNALYTQSEWSAAFRQDPKGESGLLLPVLVQKCELKGLLAQIVYIDLVGQRDNEARERLLAGIHSGRSKPSSPPAFPGSPTQRTITAPPRFPGSLPPNWNVPYPRDPFFMGGENVLANLHNALKVSKRVALISSQNSSSNSEGGVGKTQAAIEYAYRYSSDYQSVLWVQAYSYAILSKDFLLSSAERSKV
jgi:TIR domain